MFGVRRGTLARLGVLAILATTISVASPDTAGASEAGPAGVNVGFDFSWDRNNAPAGYTASFLNSDSTSLNNCGGANFTHSSTGCNFVFTYKVAGIKQPSVSHSANWITWSKPATYTLGSPSTAGCNSSASSSASGGKAPVTLFDCFNVHSFGQVFSPTTTGRLSAMQFSMTCVVPWGANSLNLYAVLYELTPDATSLAGTGPIAVAKLDLSTCPSALTWDNKTFSPADFGWVDMPFKGVRLNANNFYGVYFAGNGVPGTPPIGAAAAIAGAKTPSTTTTVAAKTPKTTTTTVPATTTTVKKKTPKTTTTTSTTTTTVAKKKTPKTTTTSTTSTTTTTIKKKTPKTTTTSTTISATTTTVKKKTPRTTSTTAPATTTTVKKSPKSTTSSTTSTTIAVSGDTYTSLPTSVKALNALRVVTPTEYDQTVLVSGSGSVCLPAGPYLVFLRPGFCKAYIVSRKTKGNLRVISTHVLKSTAKGGESGYSVESLDPLYFLGGTAKLKPEAERLIRSQAKTALTARAVLIVGYSGNLTNDRELQTELARRRAAVTQLALQAAGVKGPFSIYTAGADGAVSSGTAVADQDKNRRTIIILVS